MVSYALPSDEGISAAYVVGKKLGGAVKRNRIKRRLREAFRAASRGAEERAQFVFIPRVWKEGTKSGDLTQEIAKFIKDAGLGPK